MASALRRMASFSSVRGEKTTGLGMSIIQALVQLHGGTIWFESQEQAGTTFYIKLPA